MPTFAYVAKSPMEGEVNGRVSGNNLDDVVSHLHGQGLVVLQVVEDQAAAGGRQGSWSLLPFASARVGTRDLALFIRQLATVLESGIPLVRGLRGLAADTPCRALARAIRDVAQRIERGESLSASMEAHPQVFGRMMVSMVRAGEQAGTLDAILEDIAIYLERMDAIRTKVRSALAYPIFVLLFAVAATAFLLLAVVPTFAEFYADLEQALPVLTQYVIAAANAVSSHALLSGALLVGLVVGIHLWHQTKPGHYLRDSTLLRVPLFGPIVRKMVMSRFTRTMGILLRSGLPILDGLTLTKGAVGNVCVARHIDRARERIAAGHGITESFRSTGAFPEMVLQLMATGEEAGDLDRMLIKTAEFYDRQVEGAVQTLTSLIEPLMIVLVGGLIGVIVVSLFLPIFYLGEAIMKGGFGY